MVCLLTIFSFYYTDKIVSFSRSKDEIMVSILNNKDLYETSFVNATIDNDYIIPGLNGKIVDVDKSYNKMKEFGEYNSNLYIYTEQKPEVSITNNFDKFIVSGNNNFRKVSLVFTLNSDNNLNNILYILKTNNSNGNFFIDGQGFEKNIGALQKIENNHFLGVFGYDGKYNKTTIKKSISLIEKFTNYDHNYCYTDTLNYDALDVCSNLKMYTIKGNKVDNISPYSYIKENLTNGGIYNFDINDFTVNELSIIIKYIYQKGYEIVTIPELLSEEI